jgi:HD superfamily phosphodiesterase
MTVPDRREAPLLLRSLEPSAKFLRHACAVADVAAWLAWRAAMHGHAVDRRMVEAAALLHDVDKLASSGAPAHLRHGEGSAAWLGPGAARSSAPLVGTTR